MGLFDTYKSMVKVQIASATEGTTKFGWMETLSEFAQFIVLVALCFKVGWVIPACLLLAILLGMFVVTLTGKNVR